jgi:membrane fusion protein (multidrug efflux system)
MIDPDGIRLRADLSERLLPMVSEDQAVTVKIDAIGNRGFDARISRIHPTVDSSTHKGTIEIELAALPPDAPYSIRVGQFARAELLLQTSGRKVIPAHTVHYEPEGSYVYRVISDDDGNTVVEKAAFEQGLQFGDQVEVLSQLEAGDRIVSRGHLGLRAGKKVVVTNPDAITEDHEAQDQQAPDMTTQD